MTLALRYIFALIVWSMIVVADILLRLLFLPLIPFAWLWTGGGYTQTSAQLSVNLVDFYTRPLMRMPRLIWNRLLRRGGSPANRHSDTGFLQGFGDDRI